MAGEQRRHLELAAREQPLLLDAAEDALEPPRLGRDLQLEGRAPPLDSVSTSRRRKASSAARLIAE